MSTSLWEAIHEESKIHFDLSEGKCYSVDDRHGWWQTDLCQKIKEPSLKVLRTLFLLGGYPDCKLNSF